MNSPLSTTAPPTARETARETEFAYDVDRPTSIGFKHFAELAAVKWDILVVDEAHRLKNHNFKLALNLRESKFDFRQILLLTGTPIQNNMQELRTPLNFVDPSKSM